VGIEVRDRRLRADGLGRRRGGGLGLPEAPDPARRLPFGQARRRGGRRGDRSIGRGFAALPGRRDGGHDGAVPDSHSRQNDGTRTNKNVIPDLNWSTDRVKVSGGEIVLLTIDHDFTRYVGVIANLDLVTAIDKTSIADDRPLAYRDVPRVIDSYPRMQGTITA